MAKVKKIKIQLDNGITRELELPPSVTDYRVLIRFVERSRQEHNMFANLNGERQWVDAEGYGWDREWRTF